MGEYRYREGAVGIESNRDRRASRGLREYRGKRASRHGREYRQERASRVRGEYRNPRASCLKAQSHKTVSDQNWLALSTSKLQSSRSQESTHQRRVTSPGTCSPFFVFAGEFHVRQENNETFRHHLTELANPP